MWLLQRAIARTGFTDATANAQSHEERFKGSGISHDIQDVSEDRGLRVEWRTDEVGRVLWARLDDAPKELALSLDSVHDRRVLDLGGGSGYFSGPFAVCGAKVYCLDSSAVSLSATQKPITPVLGNMLDLPFRDNSFDIVLARGALHHVPEELDRVMDEATRILKPGGAFLAEEPLADNILASLARKLFTTQLHEPGERPLPLNEYRKAIGKRMQIVTEETFFLTSYLLPYVIPKVPRLLVQPLRLITMALARWDSLLLPRSARLRSFAAYGLFHAVKD